jgi:hypothetical protein
MLRPKNLMEMREVTVIDRFAETQAAGYGNGHGNIPLHTVTVAWICPQCGGPRGEPTLTGRCEDGQFYEFHVWHNPCGHLDKHCAVLREAGVYTGDERITNEWAGPGLEGRKQEDILKHPQD